MKLGVIGGGAWGTALAQVAATGGRETLLWALEPEVVEAVNARHENPRLPRRRAARPAIRATADLAELDAVRRLARGHSGAAHARRCSNARRGCDKPLVLCSKGIEEKSGKLLHEVAQRGLPGRADRGAVRARRSRTRSPKGLPTAVTLAAEDPALGRAASRRGSLSRPSASTVRRRRRRRDRRRGQERARDRLRRGRGQGPRPERARGADRPRLCRNDPLRPGAWARRRETLAGLSRPRRPGADLLVDQLAQLFARATASARAARPPSCWPTAGPSPKARSPRRCSPGSRARKASTCRSSMRSMR